MNKPAWFALVAAVGLFATACGEKGMTYGDYNSIIAVTDPETWEQIQDDVYATIERTVQTVRDEKTFTVTYQEPYGEFWSDLRRFRQPLLVGTLEDRWIQEAIDEAGHVIDQPGIHEVRAVWSRDQVATLIILPADRSLDGLPAQLEQVYAMLDERLTLGVRQRMYVSGINTALGDSLAVEAGFRILVPEVYRWTREDSVFLFRNDQPDPSELIRQVTVTWRSPAPGELDVDQVLSWRQGIAEAHYNEPQELVREGMIVEQAGLAERSAIRIQAQWRNPPELGWPAGGPLMVYTVTCDAQDRTYLIDAWLYAPSREKYEYMIQLATIVDTFECGI